MEKPCHPIGERFLSVARFSSPLPLPGGLAQGRARNGSEKQNHRRAAGHPRVEDEHEHDGDQRTARAAQLQQAAGAGGESGVILTTTVVTGGGKESGGARPKPAKKRQGKIKAQSARAILTFNFEL